MLVLFCKEMKVFYFVAVVCLLPIAQCKGIRKAPQPLKNKIYKHENGTNWFEITWHPVDNWDEEDPIIGYKLVIWEMQVAKKQILVDGELKLVDDYTSHPKFAVGLPKIFETTADNPKVVIEGIKSGIWYEYSAMTFSKNGVSPLSPIIGTLVGGEHSQKNETYT